MIKTKMWIRTEIELEIVHKIATALDLETAVSATTATVLHHVGAAIAPAHVARMV